MKAKFTKYGDDEFVLRMDRANALRLLAMLGPFSAAEPVLQDDDTDGSVYDEVLKTLKGHVSEQEFNETERLRSSTTKGVLTPLSALYIVPWKRS